MAGLSISSSCARLGCLISMKGVSCLEVPAKKLHLIFFWVILVLHWIWCRCSLGRRSCFEHKINPGSWSRPGNLSWVGCFGGVCGWSGDSVLLKKIYLQISVLLDDRFMFYRLDGKFLEIVAQQLQKSIWNNQQMRRILTEERTRSHLLQKLIQF